MSPNNGPVPNLPPRVRQNVAMKRLLATTGLIFACTVMAGCAGDSGTADSGDGSDSGTGTSQITFTTNLGPVTVQTDSAAPETVAAQTKLVEDGYFDGTPCHRVVTDGIYVLQCGDPTGTGTGGPGYQLADENLPATTADNYPVGTVAMANSGPNTAGSQFFIVYQDTTLPPGYTVWGEVSDGLDVVEDIAKQSKKAGVSDGPPQPEVVIETASAN